MLPKVEKDRKNDAKSQSLEEELRAEMSKTALVRIKRGLSQVCRAGSEAGEEISISCKATSTTSKSNKVSFNSNGKGG